MAWGDFGVTVLNYTETLSGEFVMVGIAILYDDNGQRAKEGEYKVFFTLQNTEGSYFLDNKQQTISGTCDQNGEVAFSFLYAQSGILDKPPQLVCSVPTVRSDFYYPYQYPVVAFRLPTGE